MGQSPPTTRHRVPGGGESRPEGAGKGAPPPVDRRPAPTPRGERAPTRPTGVAAGRDPRDRSVRKLGRAFTRSPVRVRSANEGRLLPFADAARDPRWMGQPPPTARHRVPGGGEPRPEGAGEGAPPAADRRPAPTPRSEGSPTRPTGLAAGRDHRDARYDLAM